MPLRNPLARFERRTAARFEMKSGNSSRAGSATDKRVGIELRDRRNSKVN